VIHSGQLQQSPKCRYARHYQQQAVSSHRGCGMFLHFPMFTQ